MRFLAFFAKDFDDEFEDLTAFEYKAESWSVALAIAEAHVEKTGMTLDSLEREA